MGEGKCPICEGPVQEHFRARVLKKHDVGYLFCGGCGLLQTETPFWLEEAYATAVAVADTGLVQRNILTSRVLASTLFFLFGRDVTCVDSAGGYGLLVRLMRDYGFDCYWEDKYCENLLARGFEWSREQPRAEVVTAFEVLEHVTDPVEFIRDTMQDTKADSLILSTELFEGAPPEPGAWDYYAFGTGQHVSFYQERTLGVIADILGLECHTNKTIHLLTKRRVERWKFRVLTTRVGSVLSRYVQARMQPRTLSDHKAVIEGKTDSG